MEARTGNSPGEYSNLDGMQQKESSRWMTLAPRSPASLRRNSTSGAGEHQALVPFEIGALREGSISDYGPADQNGSFGLQYPFCNYSVGIGEA